MDEYLQQETQKKIMHLIAENPGLHLSKIAELLNIKISLLEFHLRTMVENGEISPSIDRGIIRYYSQKSSIESRDKRSPETRQKIYNIIRKNPGLHFSEIAKFMDMSLPLAEYHLTYLEKNNFIISVRDDKGYYKRYYEKHSQIGIQEKQLLELLRQEPLLKIILLLIKYQSLKHKDIAKYMEIAPSTLSYHLGKLLGRDLIQVIQYGKEKGYQLKKREKIVQIIRQYKLTLKIERFKDFWMDVNL